MSEKPPPADHPLRAKRDEVTYAKYGCMDCPNMWTIAIFEGEVPANADRCRCGGPGLLIGRA